jgi:AAA family ATP:ADP antiporter
VFIVALGSLAAATPYLGAVLFGIVIVWLRAASSLSVQFEEAMACEVDAPKVEEEASSVRC